MKLVEEGYNLDKLKDTIYYMDNKSGQYKQLTQKIYEDIQNAKIRI